MNPILLEILPLIREGYCCSQLLMHLLLQGAGQENAALLRAMHGLCFGMGGTEGPCGLLSGGACILGCFAGRGTVEEQAHASLAPMVHEYQQWFIEHTRTSGLCYQILESFEQQGEHSQPTQSPEHAQHTCCALLEVTQRCNLQCPVCYAGSGADKQPAPSLPDPSLQEIATSLDLLMHHAGAVNVQLSGGEPTMRDDLTDIITLAKNKGFSFVQLNTNGLRLGKNADYACSLRHAGLSVVYLQWDDICDSTYKALRGAPCLAIKEQALQHCLSAGLSVVLVATVVKGINHTALGNIVRKALACGPLVRGVHLQPVSSFGRFPWSAQDTTSSTRITLPEVLQQLELQTEGMVKAQDFAPPRSEHALCSFNAVYTRQGDGLKPCAISTESSCCCSSKRPQAAAKQAQSFVAQHWGRAL